MKLKIALPLAALMTLSYAFLAPSKDDEPYSIRSLPDLINQTSAVVEARVKSIHYEYTEPHGPRTVTELSVISVPFGQYKNSILTIRTLGGPLPDGTEIAITEMPHLRREGTYYIFLRNTNWFLSPALPAVFRRENLDGREILVTPDGLALRRISESGFEFTDEQVFSNTIEMEDPFAPPKLLAHHNTTEAISPSAFLQQLEGIRGKLGLSFTGSTKTNPRRVGTSWLSFFSDSE